MESEDGATLALRRVAGMKDGERENVLALQGLMADWQELFLEMCKKKAAAQKRFEEKAKPLYEQRRRIVAGEEEPTNDLIDAGEKLVEKPPETSGVEEINDAGETDEEAKHTVPEADKGVPRFWLTVLEREAEVQGVIQKKDEPILEHLIDISCESMEDNKGFTLIFEFTPNPYFKETVLKKTYRTTLDKTDGEILLEKGEGCAITWLDEKTNPTFETKKQKQRSKSGKGSRVVNKIVQVDSFFNFFNPPYAPDAELTSAMADRMQNDFSLGCAIRERLIPRATAWYTGEANAADMFGLDMLGDDEEDEELGDEEGEGGEAKDCKQQ